jgi:hypothetical protein
MLGTQNPIGIIVFFAAALIEMLLAVMWNETYYRTGIPLFRKTVQSASISAVGKYAQAETRSLSSGVAIRMRQSFWFRYTPVVHVFARQTKSSVVVTGYLNWWILAFLAVPWLYFQRGIAPFIVGQLALLAVCYALQAHALGGLVKYLGAPN